MTRLRIFQRVRRKTTTTGKKRKASGTGSTPSKKKAKMEITWAELEKSGKVRGVLVHVSVYGVAKSEIIRLVFYETGKP